jgi:hypothetical protein
MSALTFTELRREYERAKAAYLSNPDYSNGVYLNLIAAELDRRIAQGDIS